MQTQPWEFRLLADLRDVFREETALPTEQLLRRLKDLPESLWSHLEDKPLDDRGLAASLRKYDIKPKVIRIGAKALRGYERSDLADAWARYLPPVSTGNETGATGATGRACVADVSAVSSPARAHPNGGSDQEAA